MTDHETPASGVDNKCPCCKLPMNIASAACNARHEDGACRRCNSETPASELIVDECAFIYSDGQLCTNLPEQHWGDQREWTAEPHDYLPKHLATPASEPMTFEEWYWEKQYLVCMKRSCFGGESSRHNEECLEDAWKAGRESR